MSQSRRDFVKTAAIGGAALGMAAHPGCGALGSMFGGTKKRKILILGGTAFLGPAIVNKALEQGHEITLFNRGRTNTHLFPDLEKLVGDRDGKLEALQGRDWDVCIDTSGYIPHMVKDSAELLQGHVGQYVFISSISVFADFKIRGLDENSAVGTLTPEEIAAAQTMQDITGANYGPLKALCEQEAEKAFPGNACNIRPGLIVGPMDRSDRFTYWPVRVRKGGEVLAPGTPETQTQLIDVRDLGNFVVRCLEKTTNGVFNATSAPEAITIGGMLETCKKVSGSDARFTWADGKFLDEHEVSAWSDMPVWVPLDGDDAGHPFISVQRALNAGLSIRPLDETVRATLDWWDTESAERREGPMRSGLTAEREAEVLKAWHELHG
jgi:nucleoside-diphosphate-sugar epimerase